MKHASPIVLLLGFLTVGGLASQQVGLAEDAGHAAAQADHTVDSSAGAEITIAQGPHARAIGDLLGTAPGPERDAAAEQFRELGPDAFAELYATLTPAIEHYRSIKSFGIGQADDRTVALIRLLDAVAQQRDAYAAGLYWHTDLDAAKAHAQATGKPILSLRMLGNLDDEYSCANSRFFRTVLYADSELAQKLREDFVLHWQSVRPVPVITIDMGDGRIIRRTITGNSCHLILDQQGRPIDVIPGLYGPRAFAEHIDRTARLVELISSEPDQARESILQSYHAKSIVRLDNRWLELTPTSPAPTAILSQTLRVGTASIDRTDMPEGQAFVDALHREMSIAALFQPRPTARDAAARVVVKTSIEAVFLKHLLPNDQVVADNPPNRSSAEIWDQVAAFYAEDATLDDASRRLIREKTITAEQAMRMAFSKSRVEDPLLAMVQNFEGAIALDTARNEHLLHHKIHRWFVAGVAELKDPDALTSLVYAELFLTPDKDPWLGLVPADTYSALDQGGLEVCETE